MKRRIKEIITVVLVLILLLGAFNIPSEAASKKNGLAQVKITKVTKKVSTMASGMIIKVKFKKVKGAKGYEVKQSDNEFGQWYTQHYYTRKTTITTSGSSVSKSKVRIRAYKIVNGQKKFGPWSKTKTIKW